MNSLGKEHPHPSISPTRGRRAESAKGHSTQQSGPQVQVRALQPVCWAQRHREGSGGKRRDGIGGRMLPRDALSSRPICPQPAEAMPSPGTVCSLLLFSVLWVDLAMAGSSFLSPEHQKVQRKESKKPSAKPKPRALEDWLDADVRSQAEGAGDELEIQFSAPFDVGIKLSGAQSHQHGQTLGKFLQDVLWEDASGKSFLQFPRSPNVSPPMGDKTEVFFPIPASQKSS
ncbi:hypothetical protein EI555_017532 [Monodon monoceros]|uniref:Appetite-regulating hormone n=1 Tax=Monodon monoceros TaxID=40151 RepID=A0A4V5P8V8_MONMO|nr:hypothetical protein EI555_017532 [Monodon monoceros]